MSASLNIIFTDAGEILLGDERVEGAPAAIQNVLVNILTAAGSDPVFPERGTDFTRDMLSGAAVDIRSATHVGNFAASDSLFFSRSYDTASGNDALAEIVLTPDPDSSIDFEASFRTADNRVFSYPTET